MNFWGNTDWTLPKNVLKKSARVCSVLRFALAQSHLNPKLSVSVLWLHHRNHLITTTQIEISKNQRDRNQQVAPEERRTEVDLRQAQLWNFLLDPQRRPERRGMAELQRLLLLAEGGRSEGHDHGISRQVQRRPEAELWVMSDLRYYYGKVLSKESIHLQGEEPADPKQMRAGAHQAGQRVRGFPDQPQVGPLLQQVQKEIPSNLHSQSSNRKPDCFPAQNSQE